MARHGDDVALEGAVQDVPPALVDAERGLSVLDGVGVCRADDPRRTVRDAEVEDLALLDENVEAVHDLLDRGHVVPPVQVEDVDPVRLQLPE